jgi:hypothetical protein
VLRKLTHVLLIAALLAMTGTHWFVLQSLAWTSMLADNLRTTSLPAAMAQTFDGKHPCHWCRQIAAGKQTENKSGGRFEWKRFEFSYAPSAFVFRAPVFGWETRALPECPPQLNQAPPVPPPRLLRG